MSNRVALLSMCIVLLLVALAALAQEAAAPAASSNQQEAGSAPEPSTAQFPGQRLTVPPPPPADDDFVVSSDVELVLLDVSVKDSKGGFVAGLSKDSFKVFENKVDQPVSIFASQDAPVTVGLIVDNSGSVRPKKAEIVTAALTFVTQSNPEDEMFVINFNDRVFKGLPPTVDFTGDRNLLRQGLLMAQPQGRTSLHDAIKTGLEHLEKGHLDKKTLVVISDGGDNASETNHDDLMRMVQTSLATIYTVGIFNPDDKDKNPGFLRELARVTGGEAFMPENISHLVGICEKIAHDIRSRYSLGYAPTNRNYDGKIRRLRVVATGADGRRLEVRTRSSYLAADYNHAANRSRKSR